MAQAASCALCELACGRQRITRAFDCCELAFCCMGCANVYTILLESGVLASGQSIRETEIFRRSLALGLISNPAGERLPRQVRREFANRGKAAADQRNVVFGLQLAD
jgi:hypothetical protein